ncbi:MAG TPA: hypothetical protein VKT77_10040 [Chthonomonadaceae bacterium]|nr:hypothetical protein [Chthonomonadaceae bacterium]
MAIREHPGPWSAAVCAAAFTFALFGGLPACAQLRHDRPARPETIWHGESGGYDWLWTTADLKALHFRPVFSARAYEYKVNTQLKEEEKDPVDSYLECTIQPLSIVGSLASYERDYYWEGGAHPSGGVDVVTINAARPGHRVRLDELFRDEDIVRALLADKIVAGVLAREHVSPLPRTCDELVKALKGKGFGESDDQFGFEEDLLFRFAFHHIEGDRVAVRLIIGWKGEIFRFSSTQIGLRLPAPPRLRTALRGATAGDSGFLMADAKKLANKRATVLFAIEQKKPR